MKDLVSVVKEHLPEIMYNQAVLEIIDVTKDEFYDICNGIYPERVDDFNLTKCLNLIKTWDFILDKETLNKKIDIDLLLKVNKLVNDNIMIDAGMIRFTQVKISGSWYIPPLPTVEMVKRDVEAILTSNDDDILKAINLCLYIMKKQVFSDGNKRCGVIMCNHYLISHNLGYLTIPENEVRNFRNMLVDYYEDTNINKLITFMKNVCFRKF